MAKKLYITVTDDPSDDSCTITVNVSPDMNLFTLNKMKRILKTNLNPIITKGWNEMISELEKEYLIAEEVQHG